jgi:hypothetical protein
VCGSRSGKASVARRPRCRGSIIRSACAAWSRAVSSSTPGASCPHMCSLHQLGPFFSGCCVPSLRWRRWAWEQERACAAEQRAGGVARRAGPMAGAQVQPGGTLRCAPRLEHASRSRAGRVRAVTCLAGEGREFTASEESLTGVHVSKSRTDAIKSASQRCISWRGTIMWVWVMCGTAMPCVASTMPCVASSSETIWCATAERRHAAWYALASLAAGELL